MTLHPGRVTLQSRRVAGRASRSGVPNLTELTMQHVLQPGYDYADELARTLFWPGQRYAGKIRGRGPTDARTQPSTTRMMTNSKSAKSNWRAARRPLAPKLNGPPASHGASEPAIHGLTVRDAKSRRLVSDGCEESCDDQIGVDSSSAGFALRTCVIEVATSQSGAYATRRTLYALGGTCPEHLPHWVQDLQEYTTDAWRRAYVSQHLTSSTSRDDYPASTIFIHFDARLAA